MIIYDKEEKTYLSVLNITNAILLICLFICFFFGIHKAYQYSIAILNTRTNFTSLYYPITLFLGIFLSLIAIITYISIPKPSYSFTNIKEDFIIIPNNEIKEEKFLNLSSFPNLISFGLYLCLRPLSFISALIVTIPNYLGLAPDFGGEQWGRIGESLIALSYVLIFYSITKSKINKNTSIFEWLTRVPIVKFVSPWKKINLLVDYPNAQNNKSIIFIEGQRFHVSFNENPSNSDEAETILITDANVHDFVVTKIQDKHLPYFLRKKEYELKAELKSIIGTKKLEIALWLEKI